MNLQSPHFHRHMRHLALIALLLMLCMPMLSRWQQSVHAAQAGGVEMCLSDDSRAMLAHAVGQMPQHPVQDDGSPMPHNHHQHDACGYCTLATRMLPVLALLLVLPFPGPMRHVRQLRLSAPPAARLWPAHSPRGPPRHL